MSMCTKCDCRDRLQSFNLFKQYQETSHESTVGLWQTWAYVLLVAVGAGSVITYTALTRSGQAVTEVSASLAGFQSLVAQGLSPQCPCSASSVLALELFAQPSYSQGAFCAVVQAAEELCRIDPPLCDEMAGSAGNAGDNLQLGPALSSISTLCNLASAFSDTALQALRTYRFPSPALLPPQQLNAVVDSIVELAYQNLVNSFRQPFQAAQALAQLEKPVTLIGYTQASALFRIDKKINVTGVPASSNVVSQSGLIETSLWSQIADYQAAEAARTGKSIACTCNSNPLCWRPVTTVLDPGPLGALYVRYNISYFCSAYQTARALPTKLFADPALYLAIKVPQYYANLAAAMFTSLAERKSTLGASVDTAFVQDWNSTVSFASYFAQCGPRTCTFVSHQAFTFVEALSVLLGLIGGLAVSVRLLVVAVTGLLQNLGMCDRCQRQARREPTVALTAVKTELASTSTENAAAVAAAAPTWHIDGDAVVASYLATASSSAT